jgi:hypothetical protein
MSYENSGKVARAQSSDKFSLAEDAAGASQDGGERRARLIRTIEGEIVPRLLVSLSGSLTTVNDGPDPETVAKLARLLLLPRKIDAAEIARIISQSGPSLERKCLGLIAPAARRLGELWERDECNFDQFIAGLGLLESVIREMSERAP